MNYSTIGAAIGGAKGAKLVAPLRLTNTGDSEATVSFEDVDETGTTLKTRSAAAPEWADWDMSEITLQPGEYIEICGENQEAGGFLGQFSMTGTIAASGSIMSMVYGEKTNEQNQLIIPYSKAFGGSNDNSGLFYVCTSLVAAPELPATQLADYCYCEMFQGCTSLVNAPEFHATQLAYSCCSDMFNGCTSLVAAPELPATQLANSCYLEMFIGCTSLVAAPELPATQLVDNCYSSMFEGCSSLNFVRVAFADWGDDFTDTWLDGVAAEGTFTCPAGLDTTTRDASHVPADWTVVNA